jgi:Fe2+ or Zn2+ uptake regulation protein
VTITGLPDFWTDFQQELAEHGLVLTRQQVKQLAIVYLYSGVLTAKETFVAQQVLKKPVARSAPWVHV